MDKKPVIALGFAGGVFVLQAVAVAQDPLNAKVDLIPLAAVNLTAISSADAHYGSIRIDAITDDVRGAFASYPRLTATDKSS